MPLRGKPSNFTSVDYARVCWAVPFGECPNITIVDMDYTNLKTRPDEPQTGHKDLDELIVLMREWRQDARTAAYMFFDDDLKEWSEGRYCPQDPLLDYKLE